MGRSTATQDTGGPNPGRVDRSEFYHRLWATVSIVLLAVAVAATFVLAHNFFFTVFLAILLGVLLRGLAQRFSRWTGWPPFWSLMAIVLIAFALFVAGGWWLGKTTVNQMNELSEAIPTSLAQLRQMLEEYTWGQKLLGWFSGLDGEAVISGENLSNVARPVTRFVRRFFTNLGFLVVAAVMAVFLAMKPRPYIEGTLRLIPPRHRDRVREVFNVSGEQLWSWMLGRGIAMVAVAAMTIPALWLLGIPQFLVLGLLVGLLTVIPFIGPILASVPALLVALMVSPSMVLWVALLYMAIQAIENNILTPLVQQQMIELPPAMVLATMVLLGALFGFLALLVATPLTAVVVTAVRMLYVEDVLGDKAVVEQSQ